jgi:biotin carboxyl carrier protein
MEMKVNLGTDQATTSVPVIVTGADAASSTGVDRLHRHLTRMAALTELVAHIESADNATAACQALVEQLKDFLSVDKVVIGLCRDRSIECKLTAVSGVSSFHPRGELAMAAQAVLQENIARGEVVCWPVADVNCSGGLIAHRQYADTADVPAIVSGPLRDAKGQLCGAWMVAGEANDVHTENVTSFLQAVEWPVASALNLVARAQKGRLQLAIHEVTRLSREKRGRTIIAACALFALILCIPFPYHPTCDCTVEPGNRRYVAAPFAGPLEKSLVEPGDIVEAGQLLARMDGREVRMKLSGTRADLHRATKQRAGHLAKHESGEAEVARYEVSRLQVRTELLEHREHNMDIVSPIAGVVVSGDLEDAEGMPLEVGQTLFEIAPFEDMVVEVGIAEDDFAYVRPGMPVTIRLDAFPLRRFKAEIKRIHPRAELRDDENVFVAEVRLESPGLGLRPGMHGTARVKADPYPLVWNLFRRPITAAVAWLGW